LNPGEEDVLTQIEERLNQARMLLSGLTHSEVSDSHPSGDVERLTELYRAAEQRANVAEARLSKLNRKIDEIQSRADSSVHGVQKLAYRDEVTGLANRHLIREHLQALASKKNLDNQILLLIADIDRFEVINDMMGHKLGDQLLARVGERLNELTSEEVAVGRLAEDEFALIVTGIPSKEFHKRATAFAERIKEGLSQSFSVQGQNIELTVCQGGSSLPEFAEGVDELLEQARSALSLAKKRGANQYAIYDPQLRKHQEWRATLEFQLRYGLENDEFYPVYLPIFEIEGQSLGSISVKAVGAEALLRWGHRTAGLLMPEQFLPMAETSGHIVPIGERLIKMVCEQLEGWHEAKTEIYATVNLSGRQLLQTDLVSKVEELVKSKKIKPEHLCFEFHENFGTMDQAGIDRSISGLEKLNFPLAIDRFGEGASSLKLLSSVDFLKISEKIVNGPRKLCENAIKVARSLNLEPIAVGVEDADVARFVLDAGCRYMQGFLFSEPVHGADLVELHHNGVSL